MSIKADTCLFSGFKIWPGHGIRYVPCISVQTTRPVFSFLNSKCKNLFHQKKNPRKFNWTVVYRRVNKKGTVEEISKKRVRRTTRVQRSIVGLDIEELKKRRAEKPKERADARAAALKEVKDRKTGSKKTATHAPTKAEPSFKAQKHQGGKGKVTATSR
ncbi:60S large subunit ribosomal protein eL24 (rpL24) [Andalucia godoyi]|uniref:60S large subunit ribosomal protein eL24 (RpL24) n=1 Tax=Andalucia godoyi TaxID=505711 RepID=A0A8K0AK10_ANDGO|nr:60S large subunit ribosomal protein eL24 (rpL24) [Andalucia godoyi]|eukprot:ANDGO_01084.mRNA.1 60S large subunit ribosomal protein eL24 (rpL24)